MKFLIISEFGETLDLAMHLKDEGHEVLFHVANHDYNKIGRGIIPTTDDSWVHMGKGYTWIFDGCSRGKRQDWLRSKGEYVFGGTEQSDKLENDRQMGQALFKKAGFNQPASKNFKSIDDAIKFVNDHKDKRWILKQNGDAPKSLNHMGKFDGNEDMLFHLEGLKKSWNEAAFGQVDFDLMEVVEGLEVAASAFFNGSDWLRDRQGKVVGFLNFEEKKEANGQTGETTGEMGTTFMGVTEDNKLFKSILLRPAITEVLKKLNYRGVFDINCIKTKDGIVALEPTCRFGIPATSYEFMEGLKTNAGVLIDAVAKGRSIPVEIHLGIGMVMVLAAKPYPSDAELDKEHTSLGERLWILEEGGPIDEFSKEQRKHIHLENFEKKDGYYCVATGNGYLLTVTGRGKTIAETRDKLIQYIKDNLYIAGMKYRTDIGQRVEEALGLPTQSNFTKLLSEKEKEIEAKKAKEMEVIKVALKKAVYG